MDLSKLLNHPLQATSTNLSISTLLNPSDDDYQTLELARKKRPRFDVRMCNDDSPFTSPVSVASWPKPGEVTSLGDVISIPLPISLGITKQRLSQTVEQNKNKMPYSVARRLARSRIVGLRHRENEKLRKESLELDLTQLQNENDMLAFRIRQARRMNHMYTFTSTNNGNITSVKQPDQHQLGSELRTILGSTTIQGETAMLILELVALRRNLVPTNAHAAYNDATVTTLECPEPRLIENAVKVRTWTAESIEMNARWADYEANSIVMEEKEKLEKKRCTRCGKARSAGSGHPRSSCDDGFRVASAIPYSETEEQHSMRRRN